MPYEGKYLPLINYLKKSGKTLEELTFEKIESILKSSLPKSYRERGTLWQDKKRSHTKAWLEAGWIVRNAYIQSKIIVFEKINNNTGIEINKSLHRNNFHCSHKASNTIIKNINKPTIAEVQEYLKKWETMEKYVLQENALNKLFTNTYPCNIDMNDILIKVSSLNDFYSTNIFSSFTVAKHILDLNIDKKLKDNDFQLVNDIAKINVNNEKTKYYYSFATKYCSHHKPDTYPIYDDFVRKMLIYFNKIYRFYENDINLKNYQNFMEVLLKFRKHFNLDNFSLKEIDRYLWQTGKKYFPKKYYKRNNGKTNP
jgi:hypothetical protein